MTLFSPEVRNAQVATVFGAALCAALAMSAGIGGGGLFVPLLILVLHKSVSMATSMSQCLIAGAALAGLIYNLDQRHPSRDRPLIDVSLVLFLAPLQMAGALFGNVLNRILPPLTLIIVMVIVLSISDAKTIRKGWQLWQKESSLNFNVSTESPGNQKMLIETENFNITPKKRIFQRWADYVLIKAGIKMSPRMYYLRPCFQPYFKERDEDLELVPLTQRAQDQYVTKTMLFMKKESRHNMRYWLVLGAVWIITLMLIFVRGGKGAHSIFGVPFCGTIYWLVSTVAILGLPVVSLLMLRRLVDESEEKQGCGYVFAEGDVVWTRKTGTKLAVVTVLAGIVAGLIGIGGGMVVGPILLELGFNPQVSSALTATNVLMSSSTVGMLVLMAGTAPQDEALFFAAICFLGAYFGKNFLGKLIKRLGKTSLIIFILGGVILLAILAVIAQGIIEFANGGIDLNFTHICS